MMQPVPNNIPMSADDFLISDDTDLDAASQWLLGLQMETATKAPETQATDANESLDLLEHHPDILPDPMPSRRATHTVVSRLSATAHSAILPDFDVPSVILPEPISDDATIPETETEYEDPVSEPEILEDLSAGYVIADESPSFHKTRHQETVSHPGILLDSFDKPILPVSGQEERHVNPHLVSQHALSMSFNDSGYQPAKPRQWIDIQNPQSLWLEVLERLKSQMTKPSFETWIAPLRLTAVSEDRVTLLVDSEFNRDWVLKKYRALLTEAFSSRLERMVMIQLDVNESLSQESLPTEVFQELPESLQKSKQGKKQSVWTPRTAQSNLNPKYTFDTFIVGMGNRFCHAAALAVAETPAQSYNPFFIYGGVGLGKTHIMQAIAHFAHQHHPEMAVRYVTAEQFTNELINAITGKTMKAFRDRYRKNDILIIDDIQFLEGKERTQEEIFHTFNALHQSGKQIILSSDRAPRYLSQLEDRLRSRFEWGLITDIQPADFETRLAILKSKVKRDHFHVPDDVLVFIAESYPNNIRELEGALNKVTAYAMLTKTILDLPMAKHLLGANQQEPTQISKEKIIEIVAEYYHLTASDLKSPSRAKDVSHARQVAIYVLRHLTEASFPKIGDLLGGRKHTTILYAYEKMKEELERHPNLAQQVQEITGRVKAPS